MPCIALVIIVCIIMTVLAWHERRRLKKKQSGGYPYSRNKHKPVHTPQGMR
ncbi:MAG: hypothetical protein LBF77_03720 [Spirochaetaceae bacterium]|jgi:hypothetical protein|nr:hypothetical protein [Spirochaetaceae bacterium]